MEKKTIKRNAVLGVLFFLPVTFLLFLYPAKHNYYALEIVKNDVLDIENLMSNTNKEAVLKGHLTVLGFFGNDPERLIVEASNLKELVYNKFQGFKKFQVIVLIPEEAKTKAERLKQELGKYRPLEYWQFIYASDSDVKRLFNALRTTVVLDETLSTPNVFIIDKDLNQRGRLDDRTKKEKEKATKIYPLTAYNCGQVSELKNKMSEDLRVLFTEYREKRKGKFDSSSRRASDLKGEENQVNNEEK